MCRHLLERHRGKRFDPDRLASSAPALIFERTLDMIGCDLPGAVRLPLNRACRSADGFQTPDVGLHERLACGGVMKEMDIFAVSAAIGGGDLGDGAVDVA